MFVRQERRETLLRQQLALNKPLLEIQGVDPSPLLHYSMATVSRSNNVFNILELLQVHRTDPTVKVD